MTAYHDLSNLGETLKNVYGTGLQDQFDHAPITYNQFAKSGRKPKGNGYVFGVRMERAQGIYGAKESAKLPEPLAGSFDQGTISPAYIYGSIRLTGPAIEAAKGDMAAFVDGLADSMDDIYKSLLMDMNRQCWMDGHGHVGTLTATATPKDDANYTITMDNDVGCMYLRDGMLLDFYIAAGTGLEQTNYGAAQRINLVDLTAKTASMEYINATYSVNHPDAVNAAVTPAENGTAPAGTLLIKMGSREGAWTSASTPIDITGLNGIFDDGTLLDSFEGINADTYPKWRANMLSNSSVNRELSVDLMLQAVDLTRYHSGSSNPIQMRMGLGQRRKYVGLLLPDVRFQPTKLKGGYETMTFSAGDGSTSIIVDPMNQPNKMYIHPTGAIKKYEMTPLGWGALDHKMHQRAGYDEWDMFLRLYTNLGTEQRNACTLLGDLTEPNIWS
jgi:hypothetical protein